MGGIFRGRFEPGHCSVTLDGAPVPYRTDLIPGGWGRDWGFHGAAPYQLSFDLLMCLLGDFQEARRLWRPFYERVMLSERFTLGQDWKVGEDDLRRQVEMLVIGGGDVCVR